MFSVFSWLPFCFREVFTPELAYLGACHSSSEAVKRLMKEAAELKDPTDHYHAQPLEDNLFEWHFTVRGPPDSDFDGGIYHGRIVLPPEYPMKPPSIILLTANGRFEVGKKICLSISGHHPETWQPSWSIRTALLAIIGFMPTKGEGAIGSLDYTPEERRALAKKSQDFCCEMCGTSMKTALLPLTSGSVSSQADKEAKELARQISFKRNGCRFFWTALQLKILKAELWQKSIRPESPVLGPQTCRDWTTLLLHTSPSRMVQLQRSRIQRLQRLNLRTAAQRPVTSSRPPQPPARRWAPGSAGPSSRAGDGPRPRPTSTGDSSRGSTPTTRDQPFWSSFSLLHWQLLYFVGYVWLTSIYLSYKVVCRDGVEHSVLGMTRTVYKRYFLYLRLNSYEC